MVADALERVGQRLELPLVEVLDEMLLDAAAVDSSSRL
jgi:hypothetical protein